MFTVCSAGISRKIRRELSNLGTGNTLQSLSIGANAVVQHIKPLPVALSYHKGAGSNPSCSTSVPALYLWTGKAMEDGPSTTASIVYGRLRRNSRLRISLALAAASIWGVNQCVVDFLSLSLSLHVCHLLSITAFQIKTNESLKKNLSISLQRLPKVTLLLTCNSLLVQCCNQRTLAICVRCGAYNQHYRPVRKGLLMKIMRLLRSLQLIVRSSWRNLGFLV